MPIIDETAIPYVYFHQVQQGDTVEDLNSWSETKLAEGMPPQFEADPDTGAILGWDGISYQMPVTVGVYLTIVRGGWHVQYLDEVAFHNTYELYPVQRTRSEETV